MHTRGHFENVDGYSCPQRYNSRYLCVFSKPVYEFRLSTEAPLTFVLDRDTALDRMRLPAHTELQPDRHFFTDKGTTPRSMELFFPHAKYERSYLVHDSRCLDGGLYVRRPGEPDVRFLAMSRRAGDQLLRLCIAAEGGGAIDCALNYAAVRLWAVLTRAK